MFSRWPSLGLFVEHVLREGHGGLRAMAVVVWTLGLLAMFSPAAVRAPRRRVAGTDGELTRTRVDRPQPLASLLELCWDALWSRPDENDRSARPASGPGLVDQRQDLVGEAAARRTPPPRPACWRRRRGRSAMAHRRHRRRGGANRAAADFEGARQVPVAGIRPCPWPRPSRRRTCRTGSGGTFGAAPGRGLDIVSPTPGRRPSRTGSPRSRGPGPGWPRRSAHGHVEARAGQHRHGRPRPTRDGRAENGARTHRPVSACGASNGPSACIPPRIVIRRRYVVVPRHPARLMHPLTQQSMDSSITRHMKPRAHHVSADNDRASARNNALDQNILINWSRRRTGQYRRSQRPSNRRQPAARERQTVGQPASPAMSPRRAAGTRSRAGMPDGRVAAPRATASGRSGPR